MSFFMMRTLLLIILLIFTLPASAYWSKIVETSNTTFYIDQATIHKEGQLTTVQELQDFIQNSQAVVLSLQSQKEYDCKAGTFRIIDATPFSGNMSSGTVLAMSRDDKEKFLKIGQWQTIEKNAPLQIILNAVCHEWIKIVDGESSTFYLDKATITTNNQFVSVWELIDLDQKDEKFGFLSMRWLKEYDCQKQRFREHKFFAHSGPMASGTILSGEQKISDWEPLNDSKKNILSILCNQMVTAKNPF